MNKLLRKLPLAALVLVFALALSPLHADIDVSEFGLDAFTAKLILTLHQIADAQNGYAIANYNIAVSNAKQNADATGRPPAYVDPPMLRVVNDAAVKQSQIDWSHASQYAQYTYVKYVPPVPVAPKPVPPSTEIVGIPLGNGYFACVAQDKSPDKTLVGPFLKHIQLTPFGSSCWWTLAQPSADVVNTLDIKTWPPLMPMVPVPMPAIR